MAGQCRHAQYDLAVCLRVHLFPPSDSGRVAGVWFQVILAALKARGCNQESNFKLLRNRLPISSPFSMLGTLSDSC